ncbi:MAG: SpoIIE family protein phosphatase [Phycisphaerae bacterium]|nr:SpoIIE family protein phosphatase [Phycisphaerae bacterium]
MRVVAKEKDGNVIVFDRSFEDEAVYVGSQPGCSVHLSDVSVAPHQLLISPEEDGSWSLESLDTGHEVRVGGAPLVAPRKLSDGDEIDLPNHVLTVYVSADLQTARAEDERLSPTDLAEIKKFPLPAGSLVKRPTDPLHLQPARMSRLAQVGLEVGRCRDVYELVEVALTHLLQGFRGRCAWVGMRHQASGDFEAVGGRYASGESCDAPTLATYLRYRCLERSQTILVRRADDNVIGSALAAPVKTSLGNLGMLYVDVRKGGKRFGTADLDAFAVMVSQIGHQLDAVLNERLRQSARVSSTELQSIQRIQEQLDPAGMPMLAKFEIAAFSMAGQESSGDVYDAGKVPGTEIGALLIAHAHAEGALLPAIMTQLHASFRLAMLHGYLPHVFLRAANHLLYGPEQSRYVGCFVVMVDSATGLIRHCRAGRIGALIINARGEPRPFGAIDMPALGIQKGFEYTTSEDRIEAGETIAFYTRGVTTAIGASGDRFREKRLINCLCDSFSQSASTTIDDLKADIDTFLDGGVHPDDMTVMLLHRKSGA